MRSVINCPNCGYYLLVSRIHRCLRRSQSFGAQPEGEAAGLQACPGKQLAKVGIHLLARFPGFCGVVSPWIMGLTDVDKAHMHEGDLG